MAYEIRAFTLTIPAGQPAANPVTLDCSFPPRQVDGLQVVVPPGASGVVGWRVLNAGVQRIPWASDPWIVTAGESISWPMTNQITSGSWQVQGYNTGQFPHAVYFRFLCSLIPLANGASSPMLDDALISSSDQTLTLQPES